MTASNLGQIALGIGGAVAVAAIVVIATPPERPTQPQVVPVAVAPQVDAPQDAEVQESEAPEVAEPAPAVAEPLPPQVVPVIDTLRVDADGEVLVAGRAEPQAVVAVIVNGAEVSRTTADGTGGFVAFASLPPSDQTRAMTLVSNPDVDPLASDQSYFIAPISSPVAAAEPLVEPEVVIAEADPVTQPAPQVEVTDVNTPLEAPSPEADAPSATPVEAPQPQDPIEPVQAPAIIVADSEGVKVVQTPRRAPQVLDNVALDTITYDPTGEVLIAGRAAGDGFVNVYLDNQPITSSRITESGDWRTDLPDIDTGVYTLRVDEVDDAGTVVSRVETPFKREEPAIVAEVLADETAKPDFQVAMTTVQPGATLWAIAQERFGDGIMYVEVFEANRDRIKDPDLIYPGQVFRVPD